MLVRDPFEVSDTKNMQGIYDPKLARNYSRPDIGCTNMPDLEYDRAPLDAISLLRKKLGIKGIVCGSNEVYVGPYEGHALHNCLRRAGPDYPCHLKKDLSPIAPPIYIELVGP